MMRMEPEWNAERRRVPLKRWNRGTHLQSVWNKRGEGEGRERESRSGQHDFRAFLQLDSHQRYAECPAVRKSSCKYVFQEETVVFSTCSTLFQIAYIFPALLSAQLSRMRPRGLAIRSVSEPFSFLFLRSFRGKRGYKSLQR